MVRPFNELLSIEIVCGRGVSKQGLREVALHATAVHSSYVDVMGAERPTLPGVYVLIDLVSGYAMHGSVRTTCGTSISRDCEALSLFWTQQPVPVLDLVAQGSGVV